MQLKSIALLALAAFAVEPAPSRHGWPVARFNHASCYSDPLGATVIFGGRAAKSAGTETDNTLWSWNGTAFNALPTRGPSARSSPVMVCDPVKERVVLYGGYGFDNHADTWEWESGAWKRKDSGGLPARAHAAAAFDATRGTVILFGGFGDGPALAETWEWDGAKWTKLEVSGPSARYAHSMVSDPANKRILLYGGIGGFGEGSNKPLEDLWEWNGSAWKRLATTGPGLTTSEALVVRESGKPIQLVGSTDAAPKLGTWELRGSSWQAVGSDGPPARKTHSVAYDPSRRALVVFGGMLDTAATAELWEHVDGKWRRKGPPKDDH